MSYQRLNAFFNNWPGVLIVSAGLVLLVTGPTIFGGRVLTGDSLDYYLPQLTFYKQVIETGGNPFWNPYNAGGFPMAGSSPQWFNPLVQLAIRLFSPITAFNLLLFLFLTPSLFFAILFLREIGMSLGPAILGGLAYLIGEVQLTNNPAFAMSVAFLPILFLLLYKARGMVYGLEFWVYVSIGSLAVALGWMSGLYWTAFYALVAGGAFAVFLSWRHNWRPFLYFLLIAFFGTILASVQLVPAYVISQFSARAEGLSYEHASINALKPPDFLDFFFPWPLNQPESRSYLYMGLVPFLFFIRSFSLLKYRLAGFFRWLFLIALFIAVSSSPLFLVLNRLPVFNYFRIPRYFMFVGIWGGVVLAAVGFNYFWPRLRQWGKFLLIALTVIDFALVYFYFFDSVPKQTIERRPVIANFFKDNPGRIFSVLPDDTFTEYYFAFGHRLGPSGHEYERLLFNLDTLYPNYNLLYGLGNAEVYDPLAHKYMSRYLALIGGRNIISQVDPEEKLISLDVEIVDKLKVFSQRKPLLDFLGIKYLLTPLHFPSYGINSPVVSSAYLDYTSNGTSTIGLVVYDNPEARSIVYFAAVSDFVRTDKEAFQRFRDNSWRGIFVECGVCSAADPIAAVSPGSSVGLDGRYYSDPMSRSHIELTTYSDTRQFLVMSQTYYPGWKAFVDGVETPLYRVNAVFGGIFVPPGEHELVFKYEYKYLWDYFWGYMKNKLYG